MICCSRLEEAINDKLIVEIEKEKPYIHAEHNFTDEDIYALVRYVGDPEDGGWMNYYYFRHCPWCGTELTYETKPTSTRAETRWCVNTNKELPFDAMIYRVRGIVMTDCPKCGQRVQVDRAPIGPDDVIVRGDRHTYRAHLDGKLHRI